MQLTKVKTTKGGTQLQNISKNTKDLATQTPSKIGENSSVYTILTIPAKQVAPVF